MHPPPADAEEVSHSMLGYAVCKAAGSPLVASDQSVPFLTMVQIAVLMGCHHECSAFGHFGLMSDRVPELPASANPLLLSESQSSCFHLRFGQC